MTPQEVQAVKDFVNDICPKSGLRGIDYILCRGVHYNYRNWPPELLKAFIK